MDLSKKIKDARAKLGVSQSQAAKAWDVPTQTLQKWEQGVQAPRGLALKTLNSILDAILSAVRPSPEASFSLAAATPMDDEDEEGSTPSGSLASSDATAPASPTPAARKPPLPSKPKSPPPPKAKRLRRSG